MAYDCGSCTEKNRGSRNCHNQKGHRDKILLRSEWATASGKLPPIKIGEVKFYQCPVSVITAKTWEILRIVNATTDGDCNIIMPYKGTSYSDQPAWYLQAVSIVRSARVKSQNDRMKNGR